MRQVIDPVHGELRDALSHDWADYLTNLLPGLLLVPVINEPVGVKDRLRELSIDGLVLSNGNDWGSAPRRDETETRVVEWARDNRRPIFGACRGLQALNVLLGGTVHPDVAALSGHSHGGTSHDVALVDFAFSDLAGTKRISVNSYHDQGVVHAEMAPPLKPFAVDGEEVVEGFYHPDEPILAIQWHPERPSASQEFNDMLIRRLFYAGSFWR